MSSDSRFLVSGWEDDLSDINEETSPHETPHKEILWAAEKGKFDVIKRLVSQEPDLVNAVDSDGYTPLHRACYGNYVEIVDFLLDHNANVSAKTQMQWEPLHSACQWNNHACALRLIQAGADVNARSEGGQTPLHIAASHGTSYETVQLLLMHPYIKPELRNNTKETAYDIAKRSSKYYRMFEATMSYLNGIENV